MTEQAHYPPISDYALIGDCRTAALVSSQGSIDWLCLPHFSGPSVFAALLDQRRGGRFVVQPADPFSTQRRYRGNTNILETDFRNSEGAVRLIDLIPLPAVCEDQRLAQPQREVLRIVEGLEGSVELQVIYAPRPDYARAQSPLRSRGQLGWACAYRDQLLTLHTDVPLEPVGDGHSLEGRVKIKAGERRYLSLTYVRRDPGVILPLHEQAQSRLKNTQDWWEQWASQCTYEGPYRAAVLRSVLTLKLMSYTLSGAVIAAPTASLPEHIGGIRNWDYRFCWLRDAALTLTSFVDLGYAKEGDAFLGWLLHATRLTWPELQVLYDVYGETDLDEQKMEHLEGYRGSRPVRVGNAAHDQLQLDIYGEVVLATHSYVMRGGKLDRSEARMLVGLGKTVCKRWREPDQGIWENRGKGQHHTFSKLMCWVALDRLLDLHERQVLRAPAARFRQERAAIAAAIEHHGFDSERGTYITAFGIDQMDASLLLLDRYGYIEASHPRMRATYERIQRELGYNGLLYRFSKGFDDFLPPGEGAFGICSFWAVDYLARCGDRDEAMRQFEHLLTYANDLGLYSEEIDPDTGEALGNFPQAFTHVGLITAALAIARSQHGRFTS